MIWHFLYKGVIFFFYLGIETSPNLTLPIERTQRRCCELQGGGFCLFSRDLPPRPPSSFPEITPSPKKAARTPPDLLLLLRIFHVSVLTTGVFWEVCSNLQPLLFSGLISIFISRCCFWINNRKSQIFVCLYESRRWFSFKLSALTFHVSWNVLFPFVWSD